MLYSFFDWMNNSKRLADETPVPKVPSFIDLTRLSPIPSFCSGLDQLNEEENALNMLVEQQWLNDVIVDTYLKKLAEENPERRIFSLPSGFFINGQLSDSFLEELTKPNSARQKMKDKMLAADFLFLPVSFNHHWYLMIISKPEPGFFSMTCLDGFNKTPFHHSLFETGVALMTALYGQNYEYSAGSLTISPQNNTWDCATTILYHSHLFIKNGYLTSSDPTVSCDYSPFRDDIASTLQPERFLPAKRPHPF